MEWSATATAGQASQALGGRAPCVGPVHAGGCVGFPMGGRGPGWEGARPLEQAGYQPPLCLCGLWAWPPPPRASIFSCPREKIITLSSEGYGKV